MRSQGKFQVSMLLGNETKITPSPLIWNDRQKHKYVGPANVGFPKEAGIITTRHMHIWNSENKGIIQGNKIGKRTQIN